MCSFIRYFFLPIAVLISFYNHSILGNQLIYLGDAQFLQPNTSQINPGNVLGLSNTVITNALYTESNFEFLSGNINSAIKFNSQYSFGSKSVPEESSFTNEDISIKTNELNYSYRLADLLLVAGRKKVKWGVGYGFSPTNIVSRVPLPDDPSDRLYQVQGSDILQASFSGETTQFDIYYLPLTSHNQNFINSQALALRYYAYLNPFDASIVARLEENGSNSYGLNGAIAIGDGLELHVEVLTQAKYTFLYPTSTGTFEEKSLERVDSLIGGQWSPNKQTNIVAEYFHAFEGYTNADWNNYEMTLANPNSGVGSPSFPYDLLNQLTKRQNYIFFRYLQNQILVNSDTPLDLEMILLLGIDDGSSLQRIMIKYSFGDSFQAYIQYSFPIGQSFTEYSQSLYSNSCTAGLRYYF